MVAANGSWPDRSDHSCIDCLLLARSRALNDPTRVLRFPCRHFSDAAKVRVLLHTLKEKVEVPLFVMNQADVFHFSY